MTQLRHISNKHRPDYSRNLSKLVFHLIIGEPNYGETLCSQELIPHRVTLSGAPLSRVVWSVDLEDITLNRAMHHEVNIEVSNPDMLQPIVIEPNLAAVVNGVRVKQCGEHMLLERLRACSSNTHKITHRERWVRQTEAMVQSPCLSRLTRLEPCQRSVASVRAGFFMPLLYYLCQVFSALGRGITIYSMAELYVIDM